MTYHSNLRDSLAAVSADWVALIKSSVWTNTVCLEDLQDIVRDLHPQLQELYTQNKYFGVWALDSIFVDEQGHYHLLPGFGLDAEMPLRSDIPVSSFTALEQLSGDTASAVGERSDVYGLGMLLRVLLLKTPPRRAAERLRQEQPSLSEFKNLSGAGQQVLKLIDQCTALLPYERMNTIGELNASLLAVVSEPVISIQTAPSYRDRVHTVAVDQPPTLKAPVWEAQASDLFNPLPLDIDEVAKGNVLDDEPGDAEASENAAQHTADDASRPTVLPLEKQVDYTATLSAGKADSVDFNNGLNNLYHQVLQDEKDTAASSTSAPEPSADQSELQPLENARHEEQDDTRDNTRPAVTSGSGGATAPSAQRPPKNQNPILWLVLFVLVLGVLATIVYFTLKPSSEPEPVRDGKLSQDQQDARDSGAALTAHDVSSTGEQTGQTQASGTSASQSAALNEGGNSQRSAGRDNTAQDTSGATGAAVRGDSPDSSTTTAAQNHSEEAADAASAGQDTGASAATLASRSDAANLQAADTTNVVPADGNPQSAQSGAEPSDGEDSSAAEGDHSDTAAAEPVSIARSTASNNTGKTALDDSDSRDSKAKSVSAGTTAAALSAVSAAANSDNPQNTSRSKDTKTGTKESGTVSSNTPKTASRSAAEKAVKPASDKSIAPSTQVEDVASAAADKKTKPQIAKTSSKVKSSAAGKQPAQKAKVQKGTIEFHINPWGEYVINGKIKGVTPPNRTISLDPGTYRIQLSNPESLPYETTVTVKSGETTSVDYQFLPKSGH